MKTQWKKWIAGFLNRPRVRGGLKNIPIAIHEGTREAWRQGDMGHDIRSTAAHYLTATAIVKDEAPYLAEWLEFHRLQGVEKVLLYDNGSCDATQTVLAPYRHAGYVEVIPWTNFLQGANHQHLAYAHACVQMAGRTTWLAVLDADEFLFSPEGRNVSVVLKEFERYPAIGVFLRCFGPSGHVQKPAGFVIENYTHRLEDTHWQNQQYKSIIQPHRVTSVISAQRFHHADSNIPCFDEDGEPLLHSTRHAHKSSRLRINHYASKSLEELEAKVQRHYFWNKRNSVKRTNEKMAQHQTLVHASCVDTDILRFVPKLKGACGDVVSSS